MAYHENGPTRREFLRAGVLITAVVGAAALIKNEFRLPDSLVNPDNAYLQSFLEQIKSGKNMLIFVGETEINIQKGNPQVNVRNAPAQLLEGDELGVSGLHGQVVEKLSGENTVLNGFFVEGGNVILPDGTFSSAWLGFFVDKQKPRFISVSQQTAQSVHVPTDRGFVIPQWNKASRSYVDALSGQPLGRLTKLGEQS